MQPARRPTTEIALDRVYRELWTPEFIRRFPDQVEAAGADFELALLGRHAQNEREADEAGQVARSLPLMWAAFWRRMPDGRTGIDLARRWPRLRAPVLEAALDRLEAARGVYAEVVRIDPRREHALFRDLFDGSLYRVRVDAALLRQGVRWLRVFSVLVEIGDGTWKFPSVLGGSAANDEVAPGELVEAARAAVEEAGGDPAEIDPAAPHAGLRRWAAVAYGALVRLGEAKIAQKPPRRIFAVNLDDERVEYHDAVVTIGKDAAKLLREKAGAAADFLVRSDEYNWISRSANDVFTQGETLATIGRERGVWTVTANSPGRFERFLRRIEELVGERPQVESVKIVRPWEQGEPFVEHEGEGAERIVMAMSTPHAGKTKDEARAEARERVFEQTRRSLDQDVPLLGGRPRDLVATAEGRVKVEGWLRGAEKNGSPEGASAARYLDLDPLRRELGLPVEPE